MHLLPREIPVKCAELWFFSKKERRRDRKLLKHDIKKGGEKYKWFWPAACRFNDIYLVDWWMRWTRHFGLFGAKSLSTRTETESISFPASLAKWVHQLATVPSRVINYPWLRDSVSAEREPPSSPERSIALHKWQQLGLNGTTKVITRLYAGTKLGEGVCVKCWNFLKIKPEMKDRDGSVRHRGTRGSPSSAD